MFGFVPEFIVVCGPEAKRAAEIDDFRAGIEQGRREFHGYFWRRRQENDGKFRGLYGVGGTGHAFVAVGPSWARFDSGVAAMLHKDRGCAGMMFENANEFGPAVASKSNNADERGHLVIYSLS